MKTIRVIQWATGPVGRIQLAEVIDNPEFDLAGVFVYSPDKAGVDAGAIAGRRDTGIVATDDKAAILALDADVVLHSASKAYGFDTNTDDIVALLESGKSVITVTSYAHLPTLGYRGRETGAAGQHVSVPTGAWFVRRNARRRRPCFHGLRTGVHGRHSVVGCGNVGGLSVAVAERQSL